MYQLNIDSPLEDGTDRLSETSVTSYVPTLHDIPEEQRPQLYCGGSLKSQQDG
jgi:hypothetical protein